MTVTYNGIGRTDEWEQLHPPERNAGVNVGTAERWISGVAAAALAAYAIRRGRGGLRGAALPLAGALLLAAVNVISAFINNVAATAMFIPVAEGMARQFKVNRGRYLLPIAFASMTSVMALYLGAEFGIDEKTIGYIFLYVGVLSFVMRSVLLGPIVDRIGETWAMRIGTMLLVVGLAIYPLPRSLWTLAIVIPLVPIGTALLFPATTSLMSRASDPRELGTTMGVAQTFAGLARVAAPILATIAFQRLGHGWPFYLAAGYVALVGLMAFQVDPSPRVTKPAAEGAEA